MTVSISNMAQVWMSNTNTYNAIAMSVSTMGYGANTNSKLFKLNVDGNTKFEIDTKGLIIAKDITANSVTVNTLVSLSNASYVTTNTLTANVITTNSLTVANRNITKSSMPTGSILQVQQSVYRSAWSSSSDGISYYAVPLTCSITPSSSTSKILVMMAVHLSTGYWEVQGRLTRNGSDVTESWGDARGSRTRCSFVWNSYAGSSSGYSWMPVNYQFLDSPATTSELIYGLKINGYSTYSLGFNYNVYSDSDSADYNGCPISTITLMEIAQ